MNMVWHLLWKDIRRFRWWLAAWFGLLAMNLLVNSPALSLSLALGPIILPMEVPNLLTDIFQILFIISVVQEDALMDSTAFLRTRPAGSGALFAAKLLYIFPFIVFPRIMALGAWLGMYNAPMGDLAGICAMKINGILGMTFAVWLIALYTRRLYSAVIAALGAECVYLALTMAVHVMPVLPILSFASAGKTDCYYLCFSKIFVEDAAWCLLGGIIVVYCHLERPNVRRAVVVVCAAWIIAFILSAFWNRIVVEKKQLRSGAYSTHEKILRLPPRLPKCTEMPCSEWRPANGGMEKTFSAVVALDPRILPLTDGYTIATTAGTLQRIVWHENASLLVKCLRFDFDGKSRREKKYFPRGRRGFIDARCNAICPASGGGYLLGGFQKKTETPGLTESSGGDESAWILKADANGKALWEKLIGNCAYQRIDALVSVSNNAFLACGVITPQNQKAGNVWIAKLDADGNILWEKNYGGKKNSWGFDIQSAPDGGYAACGYTTGTNGQMAAWLLKLDKEGNLVWDRTFPSDKGTDVFSVMSASDGGYVLYGWKKTVANGMQDWFFKTDVSGNPVWEKTFGASIHAFCPARDGGYFVAGSKGKNAWLARLDPNGNLKYEKVFQEANAIKDIELLDNGEYLAAGNAHEALLWLFKFRDEK